MKIYLKKRCLVRIISFLVAFSLVFLGNVIYNSHKIKNLKTQLIYRYQSAMESLSSEMENISITLGKALYVGTPATFTALTNRLVLQTGTASAALNALPANHQSTETVSKFLNQVSDYSLSLSSSVAKGQEISPKERENLVKLSKIAKNLSDGFNDAQAIYNTTENWENEIDNTLNDVEIPNDSLSPLGQTEEALSDYPTLIYDGPFSDHILEKNPEMLKNAKAISESAAKNLAAKYLSMDSDDLYLSRMEEGKMPAYVFEFKGGTISITKKGGYLCSFRKTRGINPTGADYDSAVETAKKYIKTLEIGNFETSYYFADEGVCVVNFAFLQDDTICYPDLIKIGVALDNNEVVFYEARGFLMNHKARTLKVPIHTTKDAAQVISPHLKIKSTHMAIIPSGGQKELYCYEFLCTGEEKEEILVYVNTETLNEEQIFILLKTDGGTLTK